MPTRTSCTPRWTGCSSGRRRSRPPSAARIPPAAPSDAELEDLVRAIAARAGIEERRFDRGCPRLSVPLPDGGRLFAVMAVAARPCVAIRRDLLAEAPLADLVRTRDAACRFPGCRQPAHRCDLDHVTPWPAGATTADIKMEKDVLQLDKMVVTGVATNV